MTRFGHELTVVHDDLIYHTSGTQTLVARIPTKNYFKLFQNYLKIVSKTHLALDLLVGVRGPLLSSDAMLLLGAGIGLLP